MIPSCSRIIRNTNEKGVVLRLERRVNANADLDSLAPRFAVEAREAIKAHLASLFAQEPTPPTNAAISSGDTPLPKQVAAEVSCPRPTPLPTVISEDELEELAADNAARQDWIAEEGRPQREVHGLYRRTADFRISTTDPDATPIRLKGGGIHLGYRVPTWSMAASAGSSWPCWHAWREVMDNQPMLDLLWHVYFRWRVRPKQVTGDTTYGTTESWVRMSGNARPLRRRLSRVLRSRGSTAYVALLEVTRCKETRITQRHSKKGVWLHNPTFRSLHRFAPIVYSFL